VIKFDRHRLIFGLYLIVLVAAAQLLTGYLKVPGWPAFMALIFVFLTHLDLKQVPHILCGALAGIVLVLIAPVVIGALARLLGPQWGQLAYVLLAVYAIVALGPTLPLIFNNYAFMYLTVGAVALETHEADPYVWAAVALLGGLLLIAGAIGIARASGLHPAHAPAAH
jgi:hypothetical protein